MAQPRDAILRGSSRQTLDLFTMTATAVPAVRAVDADRWRMLLWISLAELGALSLWFSATAVIPALSTSWLDDAA